MSHPTPREIVQTFLDALEVRDFGRALTLLAPDRFEYVGPTSRFDAAQAFINDISRIGPILQRFERRRILVDGSEVVVIFDVIATIPELSNTRVAEWFHLEGDRITRIESFFDAHAYVSMFEAPPAV